VALLAFSASGEIFMRHLVFVGLPRKRGGENYIGFK
jgi:hypothetical protein